jgi:hypothetical protein
VALVTRDAQRMEQTARQLRSLDGNSLVLLAEVADFQRLRAESARIEDQNGATGNLGRQRRDVGIRPIRRGHREPGTQEQLTGGGCPR